MPDNTAEQEYKEIRRILSEVAQAQKENAQRFKETDEKFKATDKRIKEAFNLFESQWGKLIESLVEGDVIKLFRQEGFDVHDTSQRRKGSHHGQNFEFDIIVHNGDSIIIVEVKTTLRVNDVKHFLYKLSHAKEWLEEYKNHKIYGAMAYLRADEQSTSFAEAQSLYVIRATGNSAAIVNSKGFVAKAY